MKLTLNHVKGLLSAINTLMDIKILMRETVPNYDFNEEQFSTFLQLLTSLKNELEPLFSDYGQSTEKIMAGNSKIEVFNKLNNLMNNENMGLISSNTVKKKLKKAGFDPRRLIATGGPLLLDDYKTLNPNLSEAAINSIEKKCQTILIQIKNENWENKELIFIHEKNNPTDELIRKNIDHVTNLMGKKVKIFEIDAWDFLED